MEIKIELDIKEEELDSFMARYVNFLKANAAKSELTIESRTLPGSFPESSHMTIAAAVRLDSRNDAARVFAVELIKTYA